MKILICGDRNWNHVELIKHYLQSLTLNTYPKQITIIEGGCRGADKISGWLAKDLGMNVIEEKADWFKYGKAAGPIRNQMMLDKHKPILVVAFHNDLEHSKGTKDMLERAKKANVKTLLISSEVEGIVSLDELTVSDISASHDKV
jgi:hypothetical protein